MASPSAAIVVNSVAGGTKGIHGENDWRNVVVPVPAVAYAIEGPPDMQTLLTAEKAAPYFGPATGSFGLEVEDEGSDNGYLS